MLTKEAKQTAETLKTELMPYFSKLKKLGEKAQKAWSETRHADQVARAWRWVSHYDCEQAGENYEEIQNLKNNNVHEWSEILTNKWSILDAKEHAEKLARINYHNLLLYIVKLIAYKLRVDNKWSLFYEKKGIESLKDFINESIKADKITLSIYRDGGSTSYAFNDKNFYIYLDIKLWGVCGISAHEWGSFKNRTPEDEKVYKLTEPKEVKPLTMKQYEAAILKMKQYEKQAKAAREAQYNLSYDLGLIYYHDTMESIKAKTWKADD